MGYIEPFELAAIFRSDIPIEIKGGSLLFQEGNVEKQGSKIGVHGIANFHGHCMDFTILDKTPIGRRNKV